MQSTGDTSGLSFSMYIIFVSGVFLWMAYGVCKGASSLVLANLITFILAGYILVAIIRNEFFAAAEDLDAIDAAEAAVEGTITEDSKVGTMLVDAPGSLVAVCAAGPGARSRTGAGGIRDVLLADGTSRRRASDGGGSGDDDDQHAQASERDALQKLSRHSAACAHEPCRRRRHPLRPPPALFGHLSASPWTRPRSTARPTSTPRRPRPRRRRRRPPRRRLPRPAERELRTARPLASRLASAAALAYGTQQCVARPARRDAAPYPRRRRAVPLQRASPWPSARPCGLARRPPAHPVE